MRLRVSRRTIVVLLVSAIAAPAVAQQRGVVRVQQQQAESSIPGHDHVILEVECEPGGTTGRHTHPSELVGYVLSGSILLEQDGQAPRALPAGTMFIVPAGVIHTHTNGGDTPARMFASYVLDKNKALTRPLPTNAR